MIKKLKDIKMEGNKKLPQIENEKEKRKWLFLIILILFILFFFITSFTFGKDFFYKVFNQPTAPVISGGSTEWALKRTITVVKDAETKNGLSHYEYCVHKEMETKNCDWKITKTKNAVIASTGKYYVTFRGVDKNGVAGKISNTEEVFIDNNNPIIENIKVTKATNESVSISVEARDYESGIENYGYSLDGDKFETGDNTYTFKKIEKEEILIYVKVVDKVGNSTVLSMDVKTEKEEQNAPYCELNCDLNNDGSCDLNCDTNGDGLCDINCDNNHDNIPDINIDTDGDGVCNWNCDTDGDGKPDDKIINQDPDGDGVCDLNCDTDGDNIPDDKIDTDGDGICNINCEGLDIEVPIINLDKIPVEFSYGKNYDLPSYYQFGPSGGTVVCTVDDVEQTDTSKIGIGTHTIECIAKGNNGINVRVAKQVTVIVQEKNNEVWDGWILLNLNYPDNSTNWEWRLGNEFEIRDGYEASGWQAYTGPILVKIDDVENVYIRYELNGETVIVAPVGKVAVSIEPEKYTLLNGEKTKVQIYYDQNAITKEYKIGNGPWQNYTQEFEVEKNTIIEARATKEEPIYDSNGEYVYTKKMTGTDSVFISEYVKTDGSIPSDPDKPIDPENPDKPDKPENPDKPTLPENPEKPGEGGETTGPGTGVTGGGPGGTITYVPTPGPGGTTITKPTPESKPSTYLEGPIITGNPENDLSNTVEINIETEEEAETIYYKIGTGNYQEYKSSFLMNTNSMVTSYYIRKSDGKKSDTSSYYVQNVRKGNKPYVKIEANPNPYLNSSVDKVTVTIMGQDYETLEYSFDGVFYLPYTKPIEIKESATIYAKGTNSYGSTIESLVITTKNAPIVKETLDVSIFTNPESPKNGLINKTTVSITYDGRATKKYYKIGENGKWEEYTKEFVVTENTTIYAYATSENGVGTATKGIDFLTTGIMSPMITFSPTDATNVVKVEIAFDKNATTKYYQINDGEKLYYTGPFEVFENSKIYAYNRNTFGNEADSSREIKNIIPLSNYIIIECDEYFIIKANYPTSAQNREYKWQQNGTWKKYDAQGILLIKEEYKDKILNNSFDGIEVKDKNGNKLIFKDHYYVLDGPIHLLMENLFLRWDKAKPDAPTIHLSTTAPTREVEAYINYPSDVTEKYYKIVFEDGVDTGWLEYSGTLKIKENNATIYAKGITRSSLESNVSSIKITNIDHVGPDISFQGDFTTPRQQTTISVMATDDFAIEKVAWAQGEQSVDYFNTFGNALHNFGKFTVTENGKYTIYASDKAGNANIKILDIKNIDKNAPNIFIHVLTESLSSEVEINIDYGDSLIKEYRIGNKEWEEYSGNIKVSSYDILDVLNEDGSFTLYAKGSDEAGNSKEVNESIYLLDTDIPLEPEIYPSNGYPVLTDKGMIDDFKVSILYDTTKEDLKNYYRINDGEWQLYTGPFQLQSGKVEAKSVKTTGVEANSELVFDINIENMDAPAYDEDMTTSSSISPRSSKKFIVDDTLTNRRIRFYLDGIPAGDATIRVYNKENDEIENIPVFSVVTVLTIPENAYLVEVYAGSNYLSLKEISLDNDEYLIKKEAPIIKVNKAGWASEKVVTITYPTNDNTNQYSLDYGTTWQEYISPFKVTENSTVITRVLKGNKVITSSTFVIQKIDIENPEIVLNVPEKLQVGYSVELPTSYKVGISGGSAGCQVNGKEIANTQELEVGKHEIICTVKNNAGKEKTVSKNIEVKNVSRYSGESILDILENPDLVTGRLVFEANGKEYPVHLYIYEGDQEWQTHQVFGDADDIGNRMVIVKANGNVTVGEGVTVAPYSNSYGGPKGFTLYVTGKLTNNGVINNSVGALVSGEDVYLWKNSDGTYEYVPATGGSGGAYVQYGEGRTGGSGVNRQTGGGGSGGSSNNQYASSAGGYGTSYSGGLGGNGALSRGQGAKVGGGLITIYANEYENNGAISATGSRGSTNGMGNGGSSGGGSINIFTNQPTNINQLGIITSTRYYEIAGTIYLNGGPSITGDGRTGGAGGNGTLNIGEIRKGQYYDLTEIIEQDKEAYRKSVTKTGESILSILKENDLKSGYYFFEANGKEYPVHLYTFDENQEWKTYQVFGDANDVGAATSGARNMVIVKVKGNLAIGEGVTVAPYSNSYGGPKGFTLYVTGKLTNNGVINNSVGALGSGEDVYLWKNNDGTYEYVPAVGGSGGASVEASEGRRGGSGVNRQTGGGGSGGSSNRGSNGKYKSGAGGYGTSYSGGLGGNGALSRGQGAKVGGGLITIYANEYENNGAIYATGSRGTVNAMGNGGSSGGGSINIFYVNVLSYGATYVNGGSAVSGNGRTGGSGGNGSITYTQLQEISIASNYIYPKYDGLNLENGYHEITMTPWENINKILYSFDDGNTWEEYTEKLKISSGVSIKVKGVRNNTTETSIFTYTTSEIKDEISKESFDNNLETHVTVPTESKRHFIVSENLIGKTIRFYVNNVSADNASIKVYNWFNTELLNVKVTDIATLLTLPENAYKIEIYSGSNELQIKEINLRINTVLENKTPIINVNADKMNISKTVEIKFFESNSNEYSLDNGATWNLYTEPFVISSPTTIFARSVNEDGKVIGSSTFTVTNFSETMDENTELSIGESVTAIDGSTWHVLKRSESGDSTVTLLSDSYIDQSGNYSSNRVPIAFDEENQSEYLNEKDGNIAYFIENTYGAKVKATLKNTEEVALPSLSDILTLLNLEVEEETTEIDVSKLENDFSWLLFDSFWTSTQKNNNIWTINQEQIRLVEATEENIGVRPVIRTSKINLVKEGREE